jgi:ubiquinone/menaquinone biosynthesis C-methylase UbiE
MELITKKESYKFSKYSYPSRWGSYYYQLESIFSFEPKSMLEIGVGDQVIGSYIKHNSIIDYTSADISEDLKPDVVASVTQLPFDNNQFDVACAFEVLEHVPFEHFETAVKELLRVSKKGVIISLPHFGPAIRILFKFPFFSEIKFAWKFPVPKKHEFNGRHYWEIGKKSYPVKRILEVLNKYGSVERHFVPFENQYHHFFILNKK